MAFLWRDTLVVDGVERSIALICLTFAVALVNATSNVLFLPYMITFHSAYLTAYFVGMGLSSLVPSVVSLAQGTATFECNNATGTIVSVPIPARFGVREYYFTMTAWMLLSTLSFPLLHWFRDWVEQTPSEEDEVKPSVDESSPLNGNMVTTETGNTITESVELPKHDGFTRYCLLLAMLALVCAQMNAVIPSIQSFASMPYSQLTYHLALALGNIAQTVACFLPQWILPRSVPILAALTATTSVLCGVIITLAAQSPTPLLYNVVWGGILSVSLSIAASALNAYLRTVFTGVMREDAPNDESRLFWCGVFMQVGSFVGSCVMFPLVNVYNLFQSAQPSC
jgi:hypothetical protein